MPSAVHASPSAYSATRLIRGEQGAIVESVVHTGVRAAMIATGIVLIDGYRPQVWRTALGGAIALEFFLLAYAVHRENSGG